MLRSLLIILLCSGVFSPLHAGEKPSLQLADGNLQFAIDLYPHLAKEEGNLLFSPYSISSAFGMVYAGARTETETEIQQALRFPFGQDQVHSAFQELNAALAAAQNDGLKLNIANGLCITGGKIKADFQNLLANQYDAELFSGGVDKINAWVKEKTAGKIEKILEQLSSNSVAVLLNAIYFKGDWKQQFKKDFTREAPFWLASGEQVTASLMFQRNNFAILNKPGFQVAELPYQGDRLSMVILLPSMKSESKDLLANLEKQLTAKMVKKIFAELDNTQPIKSLVYLPKFKMETSYNLVPVCKSLGIESAFDAADFTGMGGSKGQYWIAQAVHKAFMEVNEQGTEAAAATAIEFQTKSAPAPIPVFRADHPFLFLIRDQQTGTVLFMGRVENPS